MKKHNNRFLNSQPNFFVGYGEGSTPWIFIERGVTKLSLATTNASEILERVGNDDRPCRVLVNYTRRFLTREWFAEPVLTGWTLKSYDHNSRVGRYVRAGRDVTLTMAANWIDDMDTLRAQRHYEIAQEYFRNRFGFSFLGSPATTGLYALEQTLSIGAESEPSEAFLETLHANTTQGRTELYLPASPKAFYYYDRKFAYAADCRLEMPCGEDFYHSGDSAKFIEYDPAFYRVRFEVPEGWAHVGLLPVLTCDGWQWPIEGRHTAFLAEPELRLAAKWGWRFETLEAWRFGKARPLERWRNELVEEWKGAMLAKCKSQADIFRKILLHGIGGLYARSFTRERVIETNSLGELSGAEALSAEPIDGGFRVEHRVERGTRHYAPHWAAYTWSRARVQLASKMLTLPFSSLLGCHVDAIYSSEALALRDVGEEIGKFRLKGALSFRTPQPLKDGRALLAMRTASESGVNDEV